MSTFTIEVFRSTILACLITAVAGGVLILSPAGDALEQGLGLSWLFKLRGPMPAPSNVLVVSIDESSAVHLGQSTKLRDWNRSLHGDLVRKLSERGANTIVFDIFFDKSRKDNSDLQFAREIEQSKKVVLVQQVARDHHQQFTIDRLVNPVPDLSGAAVGLAPFPLPKVGNRFSHFWAFFSSVDESPTLPVVALQVHVLGLFGFDELMEQLRLAGYQGSVESPARISTWNDLQPLMKSLRTNLRANPQIYENLKRQLNDSESNRALLALADIYTGDDGYFLNFYGPANSVTTAQYHDFWQDFETQRENGLLDLTNKTVFVGGIAQQSNTQRDGFFTVFSSNDGQDIGGVEIAATAFANMLERRTLRPTASSISLVIVLIFGVLIAAFAQAANGVRTALFTLTAGAAYFAFTFHLFTNHQIWVPLVTPIAVQLPLALTLAYLVQFLNAKQAREKYSRAIRYYVPERIAKRFDEGQDPATQPELVFGVCMSTDIEGYTTLAERISEKELASLTTRYFEYIAACVERHGGEISEVRGDGMICLWSASTDVEALCHQASLAAHDILVAVEQYNKQNPSRQLPTRIGLHAGQVALGNVGGGGHLSYSVVGDSINTAARIQDLNKVFQTKLLVSAEIVRGLDNWLHRRLCSFQPKGKKEVLSIYEILGPNEAVSERDLDLCRKFAIASAHYEQADWAEAENAFGLILNSYPDDGPSQFYRQQCRQFLKTPPPAGEQMVIRSENHSDEPNKA